MNLVYAITHHSGIRIAEVGYLLILIAGLWIAAERLPGFRFASGRSVVAGILLAAGALLLIIAAHWGHFG